jgi:hypothetical protein
VLSADNIEIIVAGSTQYFKFILGSYLRCLRGGVGSQMTGWARYKRGPVERLTERGAKDVVGSRGGGGGGDAGCACAQQVGGQTVGQV